MFGPKKLRWRSWDQKPAYFNAVGEEPTLAMKGTDTVEINENVRATRSRYTLMTKCIAPWIGLVRAAFRFEIHLFTLSDG